MDKSSKEKKDKSATQLFSRRTGIGLVFRLCAIIFVIEALIMLSFGFFEVHFSTPFEAIIDSILLSVLSAPIVYYITIKPFIDRSDRAVGEIETFQEEVAASNRELTFQKRALDQHAIVSITDVAGNITYANEKFCEISGYAREELIGQNHRILKSGTHSKEFYRVLWNTISNGDVWHGEIRNKRKLGGYYWVSSYMGGGHGRPYHVCRT